MLRFQSPVNALLKVLAMMGGELEFDSSFSESIITLEGSVQLLFVAFFLVTNIVIMNVLISLALSSLKEMAPLKESLSTMTKALLVCELEQGLAWAKTWCRLPCFLSSVKLCVDTVAVVPESEVGQRAGLAALTRPRQPHFRAVPRGGEKGAEAGGSESNIWVV